MPSLVRALGAPDDLSRATIAWRRLGIDCLLDSRGEAMELRFNKEFCGVTQAGIGWSMPVVRKNAIRRSWDVATFTLQSSAVGIHDEGRLVLASPQCSDR